MMTCTCSGVVLAMSTIACVSAVASARFCSTVRPSYIWTVTIGMLPSSGLFWPGRLDRFPAQAVDQRRHLRQPLDAVVPLAAGPVGPALVRLLDEHGHDAQRARGVQLSERAVRDEHRLGRPR